MVEKLRCRECGRIAEFALAEGVKVSNPDCFTCRVCNGDKSMLNNMSNEEIAKRPLAKRVAWERDGQREVFAAYQRRVDRDRKFRERNGFTLEEWHKKVDALGCVCSFCGCELTKDPGKGNSVVGWSPDGSKSLETTIPLCRACECRKIGPLGPAR